MLVQTVAAGGPADEGGPAAAATRRRTVDGRELALGGDMITKIDGKTVRTMDDVVSTVDAKKPGDKVTIEILRDGKTTHGRRSKLAQRPQRASRFSSSPPRRAREPPRAGDYASTVPDGAMTAQVKICGITQPRGRRARRRLGRLGARA